MLRALVCPYCGSALLISMDSVATAYYAHTYAESIECDAFDCDASWEPNGEPRGLPVWLRAPGLYEMPERARKMAGEG